MEENSELRADVLKTQAKRFAVELRYGQGKWEVRRHGLACWAGRFYGDLHAINSLLKRLHRSCWAIEAQSNAIVFVENAINLIAANPEFRALFRFLPLCKSRLTYCVRHMVRGALKLQVGCSTSTPLFCIISVSTRAHTPLRPYAQIHPPGEDPAHDQALVDAR